MPSKFNLQRYSAVGYAQLPSGAQRPYFFNASAVPLSLLAEKPLLFGRAG